MWSWHDRWCVLDKVVIEWAGDEDWTCKRARCQTIEDKKRCVTFALQNVKHSNKREQELGGKRKKKLGRQRTQNTGVHRQIHPCSRRWTDGAAAWRQ